MWKDPCFLLGKSINLYCSKWLKFWFWIFFLPFSVNCRWNDLCCVLKISSVFLFAFITWSLDGSKWYTCFRVLQCPDEICVVEHEQVRMIRLMSFTILLFQISFCPDKLVLRIHNFFSPSSKFIILSTLCHLLFHFVYCMFDFFRFMFR